MVQAIVKQPDVIKHNLPKGYIVIRMGKKFGVEEDPIEEIEKLLKKKQFAYFAKFGKAIGPIRARKFFTFNEPHLVIVSFSGKSYRNKTYKLVELMNGHTPPISSYPKYYQGMEDLVGSWFKVEKSDYQADLTRLYVKSSHQKLLAVMGSAMGSSFFCA